MRTSRLLAFLASLMLIVFSFATQAQTGEPSVSQIYQTAESGDLASARRMIDQVISMHPNSAKAHYVKAEIAARSRDVGTAKTELNKADELSPGLPFVKPAAATALRQQIDSLSSASAASPQDSTRRDTHSMGAPPMDAQPRRASSGGFGLGSLLLPALLVIGLIYLLRRRRANAPMAYRSGPNDFGRYPQDVYPPQGPYPMQGGPGMYPQPGYPQREGMGSSIARGIGTGLAFGAGAVAAEEIGRRMFDHNGNEIRHHDTSNADSQLARDAGLGGDAGFDPSLNRGMGGRDFGFQDGGGWDDAGGGDFGMGGNDDWN